jgi:hypothetical protein
MQSPINLNIDLMPLHFRCLLKKNDKPINTIPHSGSSVFPRTPALKLLLFFAQLGVLGDAAST